MAKSELKRETDPFGDQHLYHAYLVRIWQEGEAGAWRASAQAVQSGQTVRFASLDALCAFLQANTASSLVDPSKQ